MFAHRLALHVWKAILDETEKISKARTTASETLNSQVTDVIKTQKNTRAQTLKKVSATDARRPSVEIHSESLHVHSIVCLMCFNMLEARSINAIQNLVGKALSL